MTEPIDQATVSFQALVESCLQYKERVELSLLRESSITVKPSVGYMSLEQDLLIP